jgi:hypothetical protein
MRRKKKSTKGLTELEEKKELWNLGDGLENVCNSVMRKLHYADHVLEERNRTIINLDSYEVTAMIWALDDYMEGAKDERRTGWII